MGIVMSRTGCTAEEAFERLKARSQAEHVKVAAVAQSVVDAAVRRARSRRATGRPAAASGRSDRSCRLPASCVLLVTRLITSSRPSAPRQATPKLCQSQPKFQGTPVAQR